MPHCLNFLCLQLAAFAGQSAGVSADVWPILFAGYCVVLMIETHFWPDAKCQLPASWLPSCPIDCGSDSLRQLLLPDRYPDSFACDRPIS